jgi:hypothetical protein
MSEPNYAEIRKHITKRYDDRAGFYGHLTAFLVLNGAAWYVWLQTPENARSGVLSVFLLLSSVGWLAGMLIHGVIYLTNEARERAIERAIQEERAWMASAGVSGDKPKRDRLTRLTEDGELVDELDELVEIPDERRRK